jgi:hypothetical protein
VQPASDSVVALCHPITKMQQREAILTEKVSSFEVRPAPATRMITGRVIQHVSMEMLCSCEASTTSGILANKLLSVMLALSVAPLPPSGHRVFLV